VQGGGAPIQLHGHDSSCSFCNRCFNCRWIDQVIGPAIDSYRHSARMRHRGR